MPERAEPSTVFEPALIVIRVPYGGYMIAQYDHQATEEQSTGAVTYRGLQEVGTADAARAYIAGFDQGDKEGYNRAATIQWPNGSLIKKVASAEHERLRSPMGSLGLECPYCHSRDTRLAGVNADQREHEIRCHTCNRLFFAQVTTGLEDADPEPLDDGIPDPEPDWREWAATLLRALQGWEEDNRLPASHAREAAARMLKQSTKPWVFQKTAADLLRALRVPDEKVAGLFHQWQQGNKPNLLWWLQKGEHCASCGRPIYKMPDGSRACDHQGCPRRNLPVETPE